ncbi:hypothetical protein, partial [Candidatus Bartonella washoeensis]
YGNTGLELYGHSRGGMTLGNMLYSFKQKGVHGIADNTNINFYGSAFNALVASAFLTYVSDGKQTTVGLENHKYDFVGGVIGGNPATFSKVPAGSNWWKETWKIFTTYPSVHACYGNADLACRRAYGNSYKHCQKVYQISQGGKNETNFKIIEWDHAVNYRWV